MSWSRLSEKGDELDLAGLASRSTIGWWAGYLGWLAGRSNSVLARVEWVMGLE